ncbi:MAG: hypothetical protein KG029_05690 [Bacteroidetes bacterium]|nr:hypothetical protein [Bacteroidota bacterium]
MTSVLQLNYDDLMRIARSFRNEGEVLLQDYFLLRQRLHALRQDWIGDSADLFYKEMEEIVLPAHKRAGESLFLADETLWKMMQIVYLADEEVSQLFVADDFGVGIFARVPGEFDDKTGDDDFGTDLFGRSLPGKDGAVAPQTSPPVSAGVEQPNAQNRSDPSQKSAEQEAHAAESMSSSGAGGGSMGIQGDLNGLGSALGAEPSLTSSVAGGESGESPIPDQLYQSGSTTVNPESFDSMTGPSDSTGKPESETSPGKVVAGAAGAVAAVGTAAKMVKDSAKKPQ